MIKTKVNNEVKVISGGKKELRFANKSAFPQTGNSEYVYIALDENKIYRYDTTTSTYVAIGGSDLTAGNGISISNNEIAIDSQVVETTTHASSTYQTQSGMSAYRTSANQDIIDNGKENTSNKVSSWQETPDNTHYPSEKLVKDSISAETSARESADTNLQTQINTLASQDKFMSDWNCETGLAVTDPPTSPYTYPVGAYFVVSVVSQTTNYRPNGSTYTIGVASTTLETDTVKVGDKYIYDGSVWYLQKVDESNFVTLNTNQTITGTKTMNNGTSSSPELVFTSQNASTSIKQEGYQLIIGNQYTHVVSGKITPTTNNYSDLGASTLKYKNLYLAGNISNGTDSVSVANIVTANTDQYISGNKKQNKVIINTGNSPLGEKEWFFETNTWTLMLHVNNSHRYSWEAGRYYPILNNTVDLGNTNQRWKDLYLSGNISNGTDNVTVQQLKVRVGEVVTITDTTYSGAFASAKTYNFTNAMTSLAISAFETQSGDLNPSWNLHLIAGANFALTLPSGITVNWVYGQPQSWEVNKEYHLKVLPSLTSGTYNIVREEDIAPKEGNYELISDETLTEDVASYVKDFGNNYKKVIIRFITTPSSTKYIVFRMYSYNRSNYFQRVTGNGLTSALPRCIFEFNTDNLYPSCSYYLCSSQVEASPTFYNKFYTFNLVGDNYYNNGYGKILLQFSSGDLPTGTKIAIYGVRA